MLVDKGLDISVLLVGGLYTVVLLVVVVVLLVVVVVVVVVGLFVADDIGVGALLVGGL